MAPIQHSARIFTALVAPADFDPNSPELTPLATVNKDTANEGGANFVELAYGAESVTIPYEDLPRAIDVLREARNVLDGNVTPL